MYIVKPLESNTQSIIDWNLMISSLIEVMKYIMLILIVDFLPMCFEGKKNTLYILALKIIKI